MTKSEVLKSLVPDDGVKSGDRLVLERVRLSADVIAKRHRSSTHAPNASRQLTHHRFGCFGKRLHHSLIAS